MVCIWFAQFQCSGLFVVFARLWSSGCFHLHISINFVLLIFDYLCLFTKSLDPSLISLLLFVLMIRVLIRPCHCLSFLHEYNVPQTVINHYGRAIESTLGLVCVPTIDGWYNSWQTFHPVYLSGCNVELGCDWLAFVNTKFDGSWFARPSETDIAQLASCHTWNGMCIALNCFYISKISFYR